MQKAKLRSQMKKRLAWLIKKADRAFAKNHIEEAQDLLLKASEFTDASAYDKEIVFNKLAGLCCQQGLYSSAAYWYQYALEEISSRKKLSDLETQAALRNYRALLSLSQENLHRSQNYEVRAHK